MSKNLQPHRFAPGVSGNPGGRPKLPPEIRAERKRNMGELIKLIAAHFGKTRKEARAARKRPEVTRLEEAVMTFVERAVKGDVNAFRYLMELMVGKIPESDYDEYSEDELILLEKIKAKLAQQADNGLGQDH